MTVVRSYRSRTVTRTKSIRLTLEGTPPLHHMASTEAWTERAKEEYEITTETPSKFTFGAGDGEFPTGTSTGKGPLLQTAGKQESEWNSGDESDFSPMTKTGKDHRIPNVLRLCTQTTQEDEDDLDEMEHGMQEQLKALTTSPANVVEKQGSNLYRMGSKSAAMWEEEHLDILDADIHREMDILVQRKVLSV